MAVRALAVAFVLMAPSVVAAELRLVPVASGIEDPVAVVEDPAAPGTLLVVSQRGLVLVLEGAAVRETPFLDLRDAVSSGGERGLLGLAFPPGAADSGRVFVNFTNRDGHTVVARFERRADDRHAAAPESRRDLVWPDGRAYIEQPFANHNGGHLAFGPDGYLYIGLGDGGAGNDPLNHAQRPDSLLGKMLRLDVAVAADHPRGYEVPADNPFVGRAGVLPEIWAFGYRNPWRYGFDDLGEGATGALLVGDVGQNQREEIDFEPAGAGGRNYGWRLREGSIATAGVPPAVPFSEPLVEPLLDYGRGRGASVTGGYVYRGAALPSFYRGRYFFGDFGSGRVWSVRLDIDAATGAATAADEVDHTEDLGGPVAGLASFGRGLDGELYVVAYDGDILRLAPDTVDATPAAGAAARGHLY